MTRSLIQIEAVNVPDTLAGAPLSVEVISADGKAQRTVLPLASNPVEQEVAGPGSYLVRAALPSGRRLSSTVAASDFADLQDQMLAKAVLDLEENGVAIDFWREAGSLLQIAAAIRAGTKSEEPLPVWLVEATRDLAGRAWQNISGLVSDGLARWRDGRLTSAVTRSSTALPIPESRAVLRRGSSGSDADAAALRYEWGTFLRWDGGGEDSIQKLSLQHGGAGTIGSLGEIAPPALGDHRGNYLIKVLGQSADTSSLVAWLPGSRRGTARLAVDPDNATNRTGSVLVAFPDLEDPMATTLFSYVRQGSLEEARIGLPVLVESLQRSADSLSPNRGVLSAYVLYKLRHPYAADLIPRLRGQYPELADVQILAGAHLIAAGKNEEADDPLSAALACGVPTYTEGVKLLRDSSNFLRDLHPSNARFRENARKAGIIAAAANFDSSLTCLRLGNDLAAEFVSREAVPASGNASQVLVR